MYCIPLNQYLARSTLGALDYTRAAEMTAVQTSFMSMDHSIYRSPKRKRGPEIVGPRIITTDFRRGSDASESTDIQSPSLKVTRKFQKLDIQGPADVHRPLQSPPPIDIVNPLQQDPITIGAVASTSIKSEEFKVPESSTFTFQSKVDLPKPEDAPSRKPSISPPPSDVSSDQFWQEHEITGWSPGNPDEDNYGINGVGYHKTPAAAYAISQKRKQQIADYRSRETREARQARGQRRLNGRTSNSPQPPSPPGSRGKENDKTKKVTRVVRFDD